MPDPAASDPTADAPFGEGPLGVTEEEREQPGGPPRKRKGSRILVEWVVILAIALIAAILIKTFLVEAYFIPSASMEPTLLPKDRVLVDKVSYHLHSVHRGDIVVFKRPITDVTPGNRILIKRVIGLPGETIQGMNGQIYIDSKLLPEPWLPKGVYTSTFGPLQIPKGNYFMMGDNRGDSADSRVFGPVPHANLIGHAFIRIWPLSRLHWF
ncbi:MAG: signal peptidase I [Acidimicrobiales bacterium]